MRDVIDAASGGQIKAMREPTDDRTFRDLAREETSRALSALQIVPECRAREILADVARGLAARVA